MIWVFVTAIIILLVYRQFIKPLFHWGKQGIPHIKPWPIVGTFGPAFLQRMAFSDLVEEQYNQFLDERFFGTQQFNTPSLCIKDIDLIKKVTVKDFDHFIDHNALISEDIDPLFAKSLLGLKGQRWRNMRATLSPSFTSSKIKNMFGFLSDCADNVVSHLKNQAAGVIVFEMKDVFTRYTNDVIASVAFGIECNSLEERDNAFYLMGKDITSFSGLRNLKVAVIAGLPIIAKIFSLTFFPKISSQFFRSIIEDTMKKREENGIIRPDMIHLLMEARKGRLTDDTNSIDTGFAIARETTPDKPETVETSTLTDEDIVAHAIFFFFGGFETSSTLMCFLAYELALNPEVQTTLQSEIDDVNASCNSTITYEALVKMKYLDMVVSEVLRKWPLGFQLDRLCVKDYLVEAENPNEQPFLIKKGTLITIPVVGIHRDARYFKNPTVFNPERFNDENKHEIKPYSYLPFGSGPRSCIASRFALLETKIIIFKLCLNFEIVVVDKTPIPLKLSPVGFTPTAKAGFWLGLRSRKSHRD